MLNGGEVHVALPHSAFIIQHSALLFDLNIEHRRVVVFAERFVRVVLSGLAVFLEKEECHLFERDGLSVFAVFYSPIPSFDYCDLHPTHHAKNRHSEKVRSKQKMLLLTVV